MKEQVFELMIIIGGFSFLFFGLRLNLQQQCQKKETVANIMAWSCIISALCFIIGVLGVLL